MPRRYWAVSYSRREAVDGGVIEESALAIFVNGQELATLMCSPLDHEALVLGFLRNEGLIAAREDVRLLRFNALRTVADVFVSKTPATPLRRIVLTAGCGGVTLQQPPTAQPPLASSFVTEPLALIARMNDLHRGASLFAQVRGVHTAVLATPDRVLLSAEDIGRHNTIDKLAGKALQQGITTRDCLLLTTGRISSEMLSKARQMEVPLLVSRTSPTSAALALAEHWAICVVGYLRGKTMRVYTHPWRLALPDLS